MPDIAYWHWIVFGVVLVLFEIVVSTFFILWFGLAAILVGLLLFVVPALALHWQILLWTLLSVVAATAWFRYLKPLAVDRTKAGLSREAIVGEVGQVIQAPREELRGRLRFPVPVLGAEEWTIISREPVAAGDRVRVVDVAGNALVVEKA